METPKNSPRVPIYVTLLLIVLLLVEGLNYYTLHGGFTPVHIHGFVGSQTTPYLTVAASNIVFDEWGSPTHTEANDSVLYLSSSSYSAYTIANGTYSIKDNNYTSGNLIIMQGCANGEIAGKVFNQELSGSDPNLTSAPFHVGPLQASPYLIPDTVYVTDLTGAPRVGYYVEFKLGRTVIGTPVATDANGRVVYGTNLQQGQDYTVQATGSVNSPLVPVSTKQLWGTGLKFANMNVYIRY